MAAETVDARRAVGWQDVLAVLILFTLALWQNFGHIDVSPFHPDETRWLNRAHYVRDLTDPLGRTWSDHHLTRGPIKLPLPEDVHVEMGHAFARIRSIVNHDAVS